VGELKRPSDLLDEKGNGPREGKETERKGTGEERREGMNGKGSEEGKRGKGRGRKEGGRLCP